MSEKVVKGEGVFVHERAYVTGDVTLGDRANVWCGACIRGDLASVRIGKETSIQDNVTIHVGEETPVRIGNGVSVGHNAVVHGCTIGNNVIVGMGSVILDGATIGDDVIIGAASLVTKNKTIPSGSMAYGNPAKVVRSLTSEEIEGIRRNAQNYVSAAAKCLSEEK